MLKAEELQNIVILEIVEPIGNRTNIQPKEVRDEIYKRFKEHKPWKEVFEVVEDEDLRNKYINLFEKLEDEKNREVA